MKWKKLLTYGLTAVLAFGLGVLALAVVIRPVPLTVGSMDLTQAADGHYIGTCQNKLLFAVVDVTVKEHRIVSVDVLDHKESYMGVARAVASGVVEKQSPDVDAISGATFSHDTVLKAVENALAGQAPD